MFLKPNAADQSVLLDTGIESSISAGSIDSVLSMKRKEKYVQEYNADSSLTPPPPPKKKEKLRQHKIDNL